VKSPRQLAISIVRRVLFSRWGSRSTMLLHVMFAQCDIGFRTSNL
jgi:hypothetical protein